MEIVLGLLVGDFDLVQPFLKRGWQIKVENCTVWHKSYHTTASNIAGNNKTNWESVVGQQWHAIHRPANHHLLVLVPCATNRLRGPVRPLGQFVNTLEDDVLRLAAIGASGWLDVFKHIGEVDTGEKSCANNAGTPVESQTFRYNILLLATIYSEVTLV